MGFNSEFKGLKQLQEEAASKHSRQLVYKVVNP